MPVSVMHAYYEMLLVRGLLRAMLHLHVPPKRKNVRCEKEAFGLVCKRCMARKHIGDGRGSGAHHWMKWNMQVRSLFHIECFSIQEKDAGAWVGWAVARGRVVWAVWRRFGRKVCRFHFRCFRPSSNAGIGLVTAEIRSMCRRAFYLFAVDMHQ